MLFKCHYTGKCFVKIATGAYYPSSGRRLKCLYTLIILRYSGMTSPNQQLIPVNR